VYRRIYGLPVTFDKLIVLVSYIIALDRHSVWLAILHHMP
jgi:hypothetical protein